MKHTMYLVTFSIITLYARIYVRIGILLKCRKYLHVRNLSLKDMFGFTKLAQTRYFSSNQASEWSCIGVLETRQVNGHALVC